MDRYLLVCEDHKPGIKDVFAIGEYDPVTGYYLLEVHCQISVINPGVQPVLYSRLNQLDPSIKDIQIGLVQEPGSFPRVKTWKHATFLELEQATLPNKIEFYCGDDQYIEIGKMDITLAPKETALRIMTSNISAIK